MTDKTEKRIHVGGLAKNVTVEELAEKFTRFGDVSEVEIKTRDNELDGKTFAYVNLTADENGFKKCFTAYNNTKWKGGLLKLQFAKQSFISKLKEEQAQAIKDAQLKDACPAVVHKSPALEEHNKKAIPGTQMDDKGTWVMGKYSRVLPVLHMKKPGSKKLITLDPSKTLHSLKRLKCDDDKSPNNNSSLTWSLKEEDSEMTKRRKGEFPTWQASPKESIFSRLQGLAMEDRVSDTEMEVVPVGRPVSKHPKPVGTNSKVYDSSDSDSSADTGKILTEASCSSGFKDAGSEVSRNAKSGQNSSLKKSPKLNNAKTPPLKGQPVLFTSGDNNEKGKNEQRKAVLENPESGGSNTSAHDSSDSAKSVTKASESQPDRSKVNKSPEFQAVKTTQAQTKFAKLSHARTPPFKGLSMLSSSDEDCKTDKNEKKGKYVSQKPNVNSKVYNSSDSEGSASTDKIRTKSSQSPARTMEDSSLKKSPKLTSVFQGSSSGEASDKVNNGQKKVMSEKSSQSAFSSKSCDSFNSAVSQDQIKTLTKTSNSDNSEKQKGPQFQFVKTTQLQGRCLKKSTKLSQARTLPFKGLSMLSHSLSSDDQNSCESEYDEDGSKKTTGNDKPSTCPTDSKVGRASTETGNSRELTAKTPGEKDETKSGPQVTSSVPKNVQQKQTRAEDGLTAIQRSHQAHLQNMAEVTLQESIITKSLREGTSSKHIKFSDSDSEGHVVTHEQEQQEKKQAVSLFEDSASEDGEDKESDHDFSIRPQFEGKKGQKLMELQSKIKDSRFRMDDRFAESDSEENDIDDKEPIPEKDSLQESLALEKAKNFSILEKVLGYTPRQRKQPIYQEMKRYVDPEKSKHLEVTPAGVQSRKVKLKQVGPLDDSDENNMDDSRDIEKVIEKSDDDTDSDDEDEENGKHYAVEEISDSSDCNDGDDENDEAAAVDMPGTGHCRLSELFGSGSAFSFFGTADKDSSQDEAESPNNIPKIVEVKFGTSEVKSTMSKDKSATSDDSRAEPAELSPAIEDQDLEQDHDDREEQEEKDTEPIVHRVSEHQPSFMITRNDPRLQAALRFFKRPPENEYEELVSEFPEKRQKIMQMVREKHKQALRKERRVQNQQWKKKQWPGMKFKK